MFKFDNADEYKPIYYDGEYIGACCQREIGYLTLSNKINIANIDNYIKIDGSIVLQCLYVNDDTNSVVLCYAIERLQDAGVTIFVNYLDKHHGYNNVLLF